MAPLETNAAINADFSERIVIRPSDYYWESSPVAGVDRVKLDRIGNEIARATSIVRYVPHSLFTPHVHKGGEEIFVIDGIFGDEHGQYPAGTYLRNPTGTAHQPQIRAEGATLFVKLQQFDPADSHQCAIDTLAQPWHFGTVAGLSVMSLHKFRSEQVALVRWNPNTQFNQHSHWGGEEIFILEGTFYDEYGKYPQGTWIRSPHLSRHQPFTLDDGALIYVKTGHLS